MSSSAAKSMQTSGAPPLHVVRKRNPLPLVRTKIYRKRREVGKNNSETALVLSMILGVAVIISIVSLGVWMVQNWTIA